MGKRSVGILGVQQGVGVTHLAAAMMHYCSSCLKSQTALVELSGNHELEELQKERDGRSLHLPREHYFVNADCERMAEIINCGYERYILDMGSEFYRIKREFLRCDTKIIIASLSPWKRRELHYFMSYIYGEEELGGGITFLAQYGKKKDKKDFQKKYRIPIYTFPYIEDPFHLKEAEILFLKNLI